MTPQQYREGVVIAFYSCTVLSDVDGPRLIQPAPYWWICLVSCLLLYELFWQEWLCVYVFLSFYIVTLG